MASKLEEARKIINEVDRQMVELFIQRMRAAELVYEYKRDMGLPILDQAREDAVIEQNAALVEDEVLRGYYVDYQKHLMGVSRAYQYRMQNSPEERGMNMEFKRKLPIPKDVKAEYPFTPELAAVKTARDAEIKNIFEGNDDRFILIIGPCSADKDDSVIDYVSRLQGVQEKVADKILIIPRIYTNKPRTTGDGYKGMLHQPDPSKGSDMLGGVVAIRNLHIRAIRETGFTCADEMLYPEDYRYLSDVLSYVTVGARSVENQKHRLTASGLDIPVGMKNPTAGDISVMMNSITAAQHPHTFIYRGWEVESHGNPLAHAILRGYVNKHGQSMPNYHYEDLIHLSEAYEKSGLLNPAVIVDTNHANSGKKWAEQPRIAKEIMHSTRHSKDIYKLVKGLMIESYLEDGCQKPDGAVYGQSITDPCLGWEKTERLILDLADMR